MDPEITEQLNESMRELAGMLAQLNATMSGTVQSMQNATAAGTKATLSAQKNSENQSQSSNSVVTGNNKLQEAHAQAGQMITSSSKNFSAALGSAGGALTSFARAALSGEEGFKKYGDGVGKVGDAALQIGSKFGILGTAAGLVTKGLTSLGTAIFTQSDNLLKASDNISKMGAGHAFTTDQLYGMAHKIGLTSSQLDKMTIPMQKMGTSFGAMGNNAAESVLQFAKMADVTKEVRNQFRRLGLNDAERLQAQADFVTMMDNTGMNIRGLEKTTGGLTKASTEYIKNLYEMSSLSGQSIEQQKKTQEIATATVQWQLYAASINKKIADDEKRANDKSLSATERKEAQADADFQKRKFDKSLQAVQLAERTGGQSGAASMAQRLMTGTTTIDLDKQALMDTNDTNARIAEAAKQGKDFDYAKSQTELVNKKLDFMTGALAPAMALSTEIGGGTLGSIFGGVEGAKTANEMGGMKPTPTPQAGPDPLQDARDVLVESERTAALAFDDMLKYINPLTGSTGALTLLAAAATAAAIALGAVGVGKLLSSVGDLFKGRLGGKSNPMYVKLDGTGGAGPTKGGPAGKAAKAEAAAASKMIGGPSLNAAERKAATRAAAEAEARAARSLTGGGAAVVEEAAGSAGKIGKLSGILGKSGKLLGKLATPLAILGSVATGYSEWSSASEKQKQGTITDEEASKKKTEAVGGASGGIFGAMGGAELGAIIGTFIAPGIGTAIGGVLGALLGGSLGEGIGRTISTHLSGILDTVTAPFIAVGSLITDNWKTIVHIGEDLVGIVTDVIKIAFFPIYWTGKKIAENWDSILKGGEQLIKYMFPPLYYGGKLLIDNWSSISSAFKTGLGYLSGFFDSIFKWTHRLSSWLYDDDDDGKQEQQPAATPEEKSAPRAAKAPAQQKPGQAAAKPANKSAPRAAKAPAQPTESNGWFSSLFGSDQTAAKAPVQQKPGQAASDPEKTQAATEAKQARSEIADSANQMHTSSTRQENTSKAYYTATASFGKIVTSFGSIVSSEGKIIVAFRKITDMFKDAVQHFSDVITTFGDTSTMAGGTGSTTGATTGGADKQDIQKSMNFLQGRGWSKAQAAGIVGNLVTESKLKTDAVGDSGKAYGIAQWHPDRQAKFKEIMGKDIRGSRIEDQLVFLDWELSHTEKAAGTALRGASTAAQAASIFDRKYERSSGAAIQERMANANAIDTGNLTGGATGAAVGDPSSVLNFTGQSGQLRNFQLLDFNMQQAVISAAAEYKQSFGKKMTVNSARRTEEDQERLWAETERLGTPGRGPGGMLVGKPTRLGGNPPHTRGNAIDLQEGKDDPNAKSILSKYNLQQTYGSKDPVHYDLKARDGGFFNGPGSGYPVELHGSEMVAPLDMNSILAKLAKTPAESMQLNDIVNPVSSDPFTVGNKHTAELDRVTALNTEMMSMLSKKMDTVISVLENSHDTHNKILRHTAA